MHRRLSDLALASLVVLGAGLVLSNCSDSVVKPSGLVQPLHATGQTNTQPPVIIDATLLPGTTSGGQQPIAGTYTATPVGGSSFSGTISGSVAGTFDGGSNGGTFTGTVTASLPNADGCTAVRPYQGSLTRTTLAWVGQTPTNSCNGTSPLTFDFNLTVTDGAPEPPSPAVAVAQTAASVSNAQQTGSVQITANAVWTAASNQPWLTISAGASGGNGTATLTYAVQANTGPARTGIITVAHGNTTATVTVDQAGVAVPTVAIVAVAPSPAVLSASAQTGTATVTATSVTSWASTSDTPWLTISNGGSGGSGSSTLTYSASANPDSSSRSATITITASGATPATLSVTQQGTAPPPPTIAIVPLLPNPASLTASAQTGTATVTATNVGAWTATATSTGSWLTITIGGSGGAGSSTLTYAAQANTGSSSRQGTITLTSAGATPATLIVTQQGTPSLTIAPTTASITASGQTGSATVTATNINSWTATASSAGSWIAITSGAGGGSGTTTLNYSAQPNFGALRSGTIMVSASGVPSSVLTITQAAGAAFTMRWRYDLRVRGTVLGTPTGGGGLTTVTVPSGTPLTIDLSLNSATPNSCSNPPSQGGQYSVGGNNTASISFLGYQYAATGAIEVGNLGPCGTTGASSGLRLFVGAGSQFGSGTLVQWTNNPGFGAMFIAGPSAPAPGLLPTILPSNPFLTGGNIFVTGTVQLTIDSAQITDLGLGEPITDLLLATGVVGIALSRRGARRKRVPR